MVRKFYFLLQLTFFLCLSEAKSSSIQTQPQAAESFNISYIQKNVQSCSYNFLITTSCSSAKYTRDEISIAFGDAYGNQIYAARLDDPATKTFERCSSDSFQVNGVPCAYQICYVYLYRTGPDGWKPESVKIYGYNSKAVTFYYNTYIPSDTWFGFNYCSSSSSHPQPLTFLSLFVIVAFFSIF